MLDALPAYSAKALFKAALAFQKAGPKARAEELMPVFEEFVKGFPKDPRGAMILASLAKMTTDEARKAGNK